MSIEELATTLYDIRDSQAEALVLLRHISCSVGPEAAAIRLLNEYGPNMTRIAQALGVSRQTLYRYPNFMSELRSVRKRGRI